MAPQNSRLMGTLNRDVPVLTSTHCTAHRFNVAVLNAITDVSIAADTVAVLKKLYHYMNLPKILKELREVATMLQTKILKFKNVRSSLKVKNHCTHNPLDSHILHQGKICRFNTRPT
jgi:hypothetical protein